MGQFTKGKLTILLTLVRPKSIKKNYGVQHAGKMYRVASVAREGRIVSLTLDDGSVLPVNAADYVWATKGTLRGLQMVGAGTKPLRTPRGPFEVELASVQNFDYSNPSARGFDAASRWVKVPTLAAASRVVEDYILYNNLGSGNWNGGRIRKGKKIIARVSYNGRVWSVPGDQEYSVLGGSLGSLAASGCSPGSAFGGLASVTPKVGREVLDPMGRLVTIVAINGSMVTVRMHGPMGVTAQYPASALRPPH